MGVWGGFRAGPGPAWGSRKAEAGQEAPPLGGEGPLGSGAGSAAPSPGAPGYAGLERHVRYRHPWVIRQL